MNSILKREKEKQTAQAKYKVIEACGQFYLKPREIKSAKGDFAFVYYDKLENNMFRKYEAYYFDNLEEARAELKKHQSLISCYFPNKILKNDYFVGYASSWVLIGEGAEILDFVSIKPIRWEITDGKVSLAKSDRTYDDFKEVIGDVLKALEQNDGHICFYNRTF